MRIIKKQKRKTGSGEFWLLLILYIGSLSPTSAQSETVSSSSDYSKDGILAKKKNGYNTAYQCEGSDLHIGCSDSGYLDIIRANFGRFSIAICNKRGNTDWSVNCMSPRTLRVIRARCANQVTCHVPVDSAIFGDPCPGTSKYVEVHYICRAKPVLLTSTPRPPRPPWIQVLDPNSWTSLKDRLSVISDVINIHNNVSQKVNMTQPIEFDSIEKQVSEINKKSFKRVTPKVIQVKVPKPYNFEQSSQYMDEVHHSNSYFEIKNSNRLSTTHLDFGVNESESNKMLKSSDIKTNTLKFLSSHHCAPSVARGLHWNWTKAGDTAVLRCPAGSTGVAKWHCTNRIGSDGGIEWLTYEPSLADCRSLWLRDLDDRLRAGDSIRDVATDLAQMSTFNQMYGGDMVLSARMLKHMAERMHYKVKQTLEVKERQAMVTELMESAVLFGSHLIDRLNKEKWIDLAQNEMSKAITSLMVGLEETAYLLADLINNERIVFTKPTKNILLSIRIMKMHNSLIPLSIQAWSDNLGNSITLASDSLAYINDNGAIRLVFITYKNLENILVPTLDDGNMKDSIFVSENNNFISINSKIISVSIEKGHHQALTEPIIISMQHLIALNSSQMRFCVQWDYRRQIWSQEGCNILRTNTTCTICECSHLTNFALIIKNSAVAKIKDDKIRLRMYDSSTSKINTIVVSTASMISLAVIVFFLVIAWRKYHVTHQCRSVLQNSGLPCFHETKEMTDKDKGKQGNFYTVTPKLNDTVITNVSCSNGPRETNTNKQQHISHDDIIAAEARQYFDHMISLQKNQDTLVTCRTKEAKIVSKGALTTEEVNNEASKQHTQNGDLIQRGLRRAMSPYNHIYMEIDEKNENYEPLSQSETYMMSTISDMSEDEYGRRRRCNYSSSGDISRHSSSRENRPLIRAGRATMIGGWKMAPRAATAPTDQHNLLRTISGVLHSQNAVVHPNTKVPLKVTTVDGNQFVCLNINRDGDVQNGDVTGSSATYVASASDNYISFSEVTASSCDDLTSRHRPGHIQPPAHSQQRMSVATMPRIQYAHPLVGSLKQKRR